MDTTAIILSVSVMTGLGVLFGWLLTLAEKKFAVKTDPRFAAIREQCGGANCGVCGYAGCDAFAQAVIDGRAPVDGCLPAGASGAAAIAAIMGVKVSCDGVCKTARVICQGEQGVAQKRYEYDGYESCAAAAAMAGGPKLCRFACLGYGDCVKACVFGAISMENGIARVDESKCAACGQCVKACPRGVIRLVPVDQTVIVSCRSADPGRLARQACSKACIACGRCVRECPVQAIEIKDNAAVIDESKCIRCGRCEKICPTKAIRNYFPADGE